MKTMTALEIDLETYSSADLSKTGVYKYAEAPDFDILLFGYSVDHGPVQVVDMASGETVPDDVLDALTDTSVLKWAHNAQFERVCLSAWLRRLGRLDGGFLDPGSWRCSMVWSAYLGLPMSLGDVGAALGLDKQKMTEGKELIRYFCKPCESTISNGGRTRNTPADAPDKWATFKAYNVRDVETEMAIIQRLRNHPVPDDVWAQYALDQRINDRGVQVDMTLVRQAIALDERTRAELTAKMQELTELDNPNSVQQMKQWLSDNGMETDTLGKKQVIELLKDAPPLLRDVLTLRQQLAKSSVKKYVAMQNAACADARCRGMFQFYGAARSGRFAGRLIQMQNLPQNHMPELDAARALARNGDYETLSAIYDSIPDVLSELIRTAFIPKPGRKFIVADFSAIEARVIAWVAGEQWRMDLFKSGGDIYCQSASQMFKVPVVKHGLNGHLRQKGKIAELACGYGGGKGALVAMGALEMGLTEPELQPLVTAWRESNPEIVKLWWAVDEAAKTAVSSSTTTRTHGLIFSAHGGMLYITLPSGRQLAYVKPKIGENKFGGESITYLGTGTTKKWERIETYGPKLVENCLAEGTLVITDQGCVPIQDVTRTMKVWDGQSYVSHDGVLCQGVKPTVSVNGICMTRDHKILTTKGWKRCGEVGYAYWLSDLELPNGDRQPYHWEKDRVTVCETGDSEAVYDLLNCGPRHRFAVWDGERARIVSNCVQGISRDILCYAMQTLSDMDIVAHVHDELIIEADKDASLEDVCEKMGRTPPWAEGLILRADGYECAYYQKD